MSGSAYITRLASFLPNDPVENDQIESVLGMVAGKPSRCRKLVLRNNGINTRHYAIDPVSGEYTHTNAQMGAEAVRRLAKKAKFGLETMELLCAGSSSPDLPIPAHGFMIHGELGNVPCEVFTAAGVCTSSMSALNYAVLNIQAGLKGSAISVGSEFPSRYMRARHFDPEIETRVEALEKRPELAFEKDFLRWMLSDGAGAALVQPEPNKDGLSLHVDWIELVSYANEMPVCMYSGGIKDEQGHMIGWHEMDNALDRVRKGFDALKQDARVLNESIMPYSVDHALKSIVEKRGIKPGDYTWFLPHYSSEYFRPKLAERMEAINFVIPDEKWFTNLLRVGNVGSASMYLILEELLESGKLARGDRLLCYVPESARFNFCYMQLTVV